MTFAQLQSIMKFSLKLLPVYLIFFSFCLNANAQVYGQALDVTFTPANPGPGAHITVTVKDVVGNLDEKQITWSLNGKVAKRGVGVKNFEFDLGPLGSVSSVTVTTNVLSKTIQIRPTEVDIIWESDGYTPPFYKGKTLRVSQGNLRLVAIPNFVNSQGGLVDRSKMVYTWRNNDIINSNASGYGKNSLAYPGSIISKPLKISIEASSVDGVYKGSKEIDIEVAEQSLLLYEDHPLYGIQYNNALNNTQFVLKNRELKVTAIPFNFSTQSKSDGKLQYSWIIDRNISSNPSFSDSVVLRQDGNAVVQSNISLQVENKNEFMQTSVAGFSIKSE